MPRSDVEPVILGIIGGIGSGKSAAARAFATQGGYLISGDSLGHEALEQEDIKAKVIERWGPRVADTGQKIQRRKLAEIVFADPRELQALEALVFPFIENRIREEIARAASAPFIILDAAVMMEAGWDANCDKIVFVDAPEHVRLGRIRETRNWTESEVKGREKAQFPLPAKRERADYVLDNGGSPEQLKSQVARIVEALHV